MSSIRIEDMVYTFMGESLLHLRVYGFSEDRKRIEAEDNHNTYSLYTKDCYLTKEEAIRGMLDSIREITDCDCGEDEAEIQKYYAGFRCS